MADIILSKEAPDVAAKEDAKDQAGRSKKQVRKRGGRGASNQQEVSVQEQQLDLVRLIRAEPKRTENPEDAGRVLFSKTLKATQLQLDETRLGVTGHKGYRTARATHGVPGAGTFYCEFTIKHLGSTGHVRLGWCTKKAELQAPVGFDTHGYGYRDTDGSKVHEGRREAYGASFKEGDIVGMLIHLPAGGRPIEAMKRKVVRFKGALYYEDEPEATPEPLQGSCICFTVNGMSQGPAYSDIPEGTYYPGVSLYTMPEQTEGATVVANFGPDFAFRPPVDGFPPAEPISSLAVVVDVS